MVNESDLRAIFPIWIVVLIMGSFLPVEAKQALGTQSALGAPGDPPVPHRMWHIASFGCTALLSSLICRTQRQRIMSALAVSTLGVLIEVFQQLIFGVNLEWWDIRDDGYGVILLGLLGEIPIVRRCLLSRRP